jgi:hypothetical protein
MATGQMDQLIIGWHQKRQMRSGPPNPLQAAEAELAAATDAGDQERVDAANEQLDRLVSEARERQREEAARVQASFSSGVRRPIIPRPSPSAQMNEIMVLASGRIPNRPPRRRLL